MVVTRPEFYKAFKCIADKCQDSCCVGWEIVVDRETRGKYNNIPGDFGEKLRESLVEDDAGSTCFKLDENERCPFLNKNNLCDIIINCGEELLCGICTEHPRFYNEISESIECGLGLCCEEVCRLLLETDEPLEYVTEIVPEDEISIGFCLDESVHKDYIALYNLRAKMFEILNSNISFDCKLNALKQMAEEVINEKIVFDSDGARLGEGIDAMDAIAEILAASTGYALEAPVGLASHGGFKDWFIREMGRPGFTFEVGKGENPLPCEQLDPIYQRLEESLLLAAVMGD